MATNTLKTLLMSRRVAKAQLTRICKTLEGDASKEIDALNVLKQKLESLDTQYQRIQLEIEVLDETTDHESEREQFEVTHENCLIRVTRLIRDLTSTPVSNVSGSATPSCSKHSTIKGFEQFLPKFDIEPFDGNPSKWHSFRDSFRSLVHDSDELPAVQKFHFLKNSLRGEVRSIVSEFTASAENYHVAWEMLQKRCDEPRRIIYTHLRTLFDLPQLTRESPTALKALVQSAESRVNALKTLKQPVHQWDTILVFILINKLDKATRREWDRTLENTDMPTFADLLQFLHKFARGDDEGPVNVHQPKPFAINHKRSHHTGNRAQAFVGTQESLQCPICQQDHVIVRCSAFMKLAPRARLDAARKQKLCINCLRANHDAKNCRSGGCRKCQRFHHSLLHFNNDNIREGPSESEMHCQEAPDTRRGTSLAALCNSEVLLGTARVIIVDKDGNEHDCRAILDSCSQNNFITEHLANKLQLSRIERRVNLSGLGSLSVHSNHIVRTKIKSKHNAFETDIELLTLAQITNILPSRKVNRKSLELPKNLKLADPDFGTPGSIDLLIGNILFFTLLSVGQIRIPRTAVSLQKTRLGWLVTGEASTSQQSRKTCLISNGDLDEQLTRFWAMENTEHTIFHSKEENACERHFQNTTCRDASGRYIVRLPFNDTRNSLGESYNMALRRFYSLENRLYRNPALQQQYTDFLREYLTLGHMSEVTTSQHSDHGYYLPHHAVIKSASETTKLRVVFDGSATTSTGVSLNSILMAGPTIQDDLFSIVTRFRSYAFVLTADIEKMYRQIRMHDEDTRYQKILWRESREGPIRKFSLNTVTYGTTSAPFLAVRCLEQLAEDEGARFPLAAHSFKHDFYVDDLLTGTHSLVEAMELKEQLIQLAKLGGFNLRQWASNDSSIISELTNRSINSQIQLEKSEVQKTLGIIWSTVDDTIKYSTNVQVATKTITKRTILSRIAQLFDPLGLLGPVIILGKILMQQLWIAKVGWDESLPQELQHAWIEFSREIPFLNRFSIPRRILVDQPINIQLHGFCDASQSAYGACIYLRSTDSAGNTLVRLVCAKSRVAPIKTVSLPRLELCAAVLLTRLYKTTEASLKIQINSTHFWSDSTITLQWINLSPHTLQTFVANRVAEIQGHTTVQCWSHVSSKENPADFISRGQKPSEFNSNELWKHGPKWLRLDASSWPTVQVTTIDHPVPEQRRMTTLVATPVSTDFFENFSSIVTLNRFVAYSLRWLNHRTCKRSGALSPEELERAHYKIIALIQAEAFTHEIIALKANQDVSRKSKLLCLNPFIDKLGILRVGGRLKHAPISFNQKYPIILPRSNHVTRLVIRYEHLRHWHAGTQATLNAVRQRYWPINGKTVTRHIIHQCIRCFKSNPVAACYKMGDLPKRRITVSRPFENVGIDYCGPFYIKEKRLRNRNRVKIYVAVLVCLTTKAVHLELVEDLTTEACIACLKRFFCRRGNPSHIYSDNATTFVGAKNEFLEFQALVRSANHNDLIASALCKKGITWHFSPPRSPHFGGLWEASVKSFKNHLRRTVGDSLFTYEQFNTYIIEIEAILNSRPLITLSNDPSDLIALTPSHFLIGDNLMNMPEPDVKEIPSNRLSVWQHIQKVKQHFWIRWQKEYLHELQVRSKWKLGNTNHIKVGTLVVIREDNLPPMHWKLGRIVKLHPGDDGLIRAVDVRTATGIYTRATKLLCPLPLDPSGH